MHSKSDNIEIIIYGKPEEVVEEFFESFIHRYQSNLQESMKGSDFVSFIMFIYCIVNVIKYTPIAVDNI